MCIGTLRALHGHIEHGVGRYGGLLGIPFGSISCPHLHMFNLPNQGIGMVVAKDASHKEKGEWHE